MKNNIDRKQIINKTLNQLQQEYPYVRDFFSSMSLDYPEKEQDRTIEAVFHYMDAYDLEQKGIDKTLLPVLFMDYLEHMQKHAGRNTAKLSSVTIIGGHNKSGFPENLDITLKCGEILSVVGRTGSGKSRLLADIEWLAQKDTPTGRQLLINGEVPLPEWRFELGHKLVAQLSQNMNFVMDLSAADFIRMHAESRMIKNIDSKIKIILREANKLAGEAIYEDTPVTSLSGGQSRALMIADTAFLSASPIVLIDEIENAGIDRKTAVKLLIKSEKIVIIATHDPVLALYADRRLVIQNGGMYKLLPTTEGEKRKLDELESLNSMLLMYREKLKMGESLA